MADRARQATEISAAIISIHRISYARELSSVDTVVRDGFVAAVLRFEMPPAERLVLEAGDPDAVMRLYDATEGSLETALLRRRGANDRPHRARVPVVDEPAARDHPRGLRARPDSGDEARACRSAPGPARPRVSA